MRVDRPQGDAPADRRSPTPKPRPTARPTARTDRAAEGSDHGGSETDAQTDTDTESDPDADTDAGTQPDHEVSVLEPSVLASPRPAIGLGLSAEANGRGPGGVNGGGRSTDIDSALAFSVGLLTASLVALTAWALQLRRSTNARGQSRSID